MEGRLAWINPYGTNLRVEDTPYICLLEPPNQDEVQAVDHFSKALFRAYRTDAYLLVLLHRVVIYCSIADSVVSKQQRLVLHGHRAFNSPNWIVRAKGLA